MNLIPEFNDKQLDRISEFLSNLSLLIIATLILPNIFGANKPNADDLLSGITLTIMFLLVSMILVKEQNE